MPDKYHVLIDDKEYGPYDLSSLKEHVTQERIGANDLVWMEGMTDWIPVGQLLQEKGNSPVPPPHPKRSPAPPPKPERQKEVPLSAPVSPSTGEIPPQSQHDSNATQGKPKWYYRTWLIVLAIFTITPVGIVLMWMQRPRSKFLGKLPSRIVITILFGTVWLINMYGFLFEGDIYVECEVAADENGFVCFVSGNEGFGDETVCWNIKTQCANGAAPHIRDCIVVGPGETVQKYVALDNFVGIDSCDYLSETRITDVSFK